MKRPNSATRNGQEWPQIMVRVNKHARPGEDEPQWAKARIVAKVRGASLYRYLAFRDGPTVKTLYLGSCRERKDW